MGKAISWTAVCLNGLWLLIGVWILLTQFGHRTGPSGDAAYVVGYWIGLGGFMLVLLGAPVLSILALVFGARLREPPAKPLDSVFE
jgi:hypothetical protein